MAEYIQKPMQVVNAEDMINLDETLESVKWRNLFALMLNARFGCISMGRMQGKRYISELIRNRALRLCWKRSPKTRYKQLEKARRMKNYGGVYSDTNPGR